MNRFPIILIVLLLWSCRGAEQSLSQPVRSDGDTLQLDYATGFAVVNHAGYREIIVHNPWSDDGKPLCTYLLVPDSVSLPADMPHGVVVRTPLKRAVVYSTVHQQLAAELGAFDAVAGVCDVDYVYEPELTRRINAGLIADCGPNTSPVVERIIQLSPDAIMLSPYENSSGHDHLTHLGVPMIECADYMEPTPLGRAEWMRLYGMLFGCEQRADSLWRVTRDNYQSLVATAATAVARPKILVDMPYGASWFVPGVNSSMHRFIVDAGGVNPFAGYSKAVNNGLSVERVLAEASDADLWFIRYNSAYDLTMNQLVTDNALLGRFDAVAGNRIYGCNTSKVRYYEETPFHPDRLLAQLIVILHPELADSAVVKHKYFTQI